MEFLKSEIERKRKANEESKKEFKNKYIKRGTLEKMEEEKYYAKQAVKSTQSEPKTVTEIVVKEQGNEIKTPDAATNLMVISKLRSLKMPIRLFGETDIERLQRLEKNTLSEDRIQGKQFADLVKQNDQKLEEDLAKDNALKENDKYNVDLNTNAQIDTSAICTDLLKNDPDFCCYLISVFLKRILMEWENYLQLRTDDEKSTQEGKLETINFAQAKDNLKALFKGLKKKTLGENVLIKITEMCYFVQLREYMKANDSYICLSIGRAAWPIGVTMVGIQFI